jgi:putative ABC transport system permease protein
METLWQDVKYGARMLLQSRGVTLIAVITLALGIGANTAIFSVLNAVVLRPLPYPDSDRLMLLTEWSEQVPNMSFSIANFKDLREQQTVFESVGAFRTNIYVLTGEGDPERLIGRQVSHDFFQTIRVRPILGRVLGPDEDRPGAEPVVMLSEGYWERRFGRDPGIIGRKLTMNNESFEVIGVLPGTFHGTWQTAEVWMSLLRLEEQIGGPQRRGSHPGIYVVGLRKPGVSEPQAEADVKAIAARLAAEYPNSNAEQSMTATGFQAFLIRDLRPRVLILMAAVGFVLLIACANLANLLLARGAGRRREIAIRAALGAGRGRLVRQMLTESVLLSIAGGVAGLGVAWAGLRGLLAITPTNVPRMDEVALDGTVLAFTAALAILTGLFFGIVPAWHAARTDLNETLKEGGRSGRGGERRHWVRSALVVTEVALALVLLVGAGLMLKSFSNILAADAGINPEGVLTATVAPPPTLGNEPEKIRPYITRVLEQVKAIPGVEAAATTLPLLGGWQTGFWVEGRPFPPPGQFPSTDIARVSPDYFQVMGQRLLRGRYFTEHDTADSTPVAIVDQTLADTYWPGEDPIGKRMRFGGPQSEAPWMEIVGVVAHVKNYGVDEESRVETYIPVLQSPNRFFTVVLRTQGDPASFVPALRQAVREADREAVLFDPRTMEEIASDAVAERRLAALLLGVFSALAMLLAAVGLYGVMSYAVSQRTHEIGVRMALGAQRGDVFRLLLGQGMLLTAIGLVIGLTGAWWVTRYLETQLFGVSATDPLTFLLLPLAMAAVALVAAFVPARRATRVDPVIALRYE